MIGPRLHEDEVGERSGSHRWVAYVWGAFVLGFSAIGYFVAVWVTTLPPDSSVPFWQIVLACPILLYTLGADFISPEAMATLRLFNAILYGVIGFNVGAICVGVRMAFLRRR